MFIKDKKDLYLLKEILENIRKNDITEDTYCNIFDVITPKNKMGVDMVDYFSTDKIPEALFDPSQNLIAFNKKSLDRYIDKNVFIVKSMYSNVNLNEFRIYLPLHIAFHEMMHAYQYAMCIDNMDAPYKVIKEGYSNIFDFFDKKSDNTKKKIARYLYNRSRKESVIERNAQIESLYLCAVVANYEDNYSTKELMKSLLMEECEIGYVDNIYGSMHKTYKNLLLSDKNLNYNEVSSTEEKIRYGLPIDTKTRVKLLNKEYKIML